jgi:hypothetical protein
MTDLTRCIRLSRVHLVIGAGERPKQAGGQGDANFARDELWVR